MLASDDSPISLLESNDQVSELCSSLSSIESIALDTEFVRTSTFYGRLGLIQLCDGKACYLIDPLNISDWDPLANLLKGTDIRTVCHSSSEDLNLLQTTINLIPTTIFDSQVAAAFLGIGFSLSYQALVKLVLGKHIEKDVTRSDWLARPLTERQLQYAADDVCYLLTLETCLREKLKQANKMEWFEDECANILINAQGVENPSNWETCYSSISNSWKLKEEELECLQQLCFWREVQARERNKPKNWVAKDSDLLNLALVFAGSSRVTMEALAEETRIDKGLLRKDGQEILDLLKSSRYKLVPISRDLLNYPLGPSARKKLKQCQVDVTEIAEKLSIAPELLARKRALQKLIRDYEHTGQLIWSGELAGWRRGVLEDRFISLF